MCVCVLYFFFVYIFYCGSWQHAPSREMMQKNEKYETFCFIKWRVCSFFFLMFFFLWIFSEPQKINEKNFEERNAHACVCVCVSDCGVCNCACAGIPPRLSFFKGGQGKGWGGEGWSKDICSVGLLDFWLGSQILGFKSRKATKDQREQQLCYNCAYHLCYFVA